MSASALRHTQSDAARDERKMQLETRERRQRCPRTRAWMISCFTTAIAICRICGDTMLTKLSVQKLTCPATGLKHKNSYALYQVIVLCSLVQDLEGLIVKDDT